MERILLGRTRRKGSRSRKKVVLEEDPPSSTETPIEEKAAEEPLPEEEMIVWDAVEWSDMEPPSDESVFVDGRTDSILREVLTTAWEDGKITPDEMALITSISKGLGIGLDVLDRLVKETRPGPPRDDEPEPESAPEETMTEEDVQAPVLEEDEVSEPLPMEDLPEGSESDPWSDMMDELDGEGTDQTFLSPREAEAPPPKSSIPLPGREPGRTIDITQIGAAASPAQNPGMITLTSTIREGVKPLTTNFEISSDIDRQQVRTRCPTCRSQVRFDPSTGRDRCPVCGASIASGDPGSDMVRSLLDQARHALKASDFHGAMEVLDRVLDRSPDNKEAMFYRLKVQYALTTKGMAGTRVTTLDSRDRSSFGTGVPRLDTLVRGGIPIGAQVMLKGPAFCGKDILMEHILASALRSGFPAIFVSSNRAMKDVLKGILRRIPDFKGFNRDGRVRMYDLFTKYPGQQVLRDGHRLFNIANAEDFGIFQEDLLFVQEELYKEFGGGVLILNSLSPLINQVQPQPLQKFLQALIARSKGYRFSNIFDLASGIHNEQIVNSIEYQMDGIVDMREQDGRYSLRIRGFSQSVLTRDWIEYSFSERGFDLHGSFTEERIV